MPTAISEWRDRRVRGGMHIICNECARQIKWELSKGESNGIIVHFYFGVCPHCKIVYIGEGYETEMPAHSFFLSGESNA